MFHDFLESDQDYIKINLLSFEYKLTHDILKFIFTVNTLEYQDICLILNNKFIFDNTKSQDIKIKIISNYYKIIKISNIHVLYALSEYFNSEYLLEYITSYLLDLSKLNNSSIFDKNKINIEMNITKHTNYQGYITNISDLNIQNIALDYLSTKITQYLSSIILVLNKTSKTDLILDLLKKSKNILIKYQDISGLSFRYVYELVDRSKLSLKTQDYQYDSFFKTSVHFYKTSKFKYNYNYDFSIIYPDIFTGLDMKNIVTTGNFILKKIFKINTSLEYKIYPGSKNLISTILYFSKYTPVFGYLGWTKSKIIKIEIENMIIEISDGCFYTDILNSYDYEKVYIKYNKLYSSLEFCKFLDDLVIKNSLCSCKISKKRYFLWRYRNELE